MSGDNGSILTPKGLYDTLHGRRALVQKEFICRSQVVFLRGNIVGHIFTLDEFKTFLEKISISESRRMAAFDIFEKFSRDWGATGHKVFPIELVDGLFDMLSK